MGYGEEERLGAADIRARLMAADADFADAFGTAPRWKMAIAGGAPLILLGLIRRQTPDIDAALGPRKVEGLFAKHDINFDMTRVNSLPYFFEDRLVPMGLPTRVLDYFQVSLEDIAASKLGAGRPKDIEDLWSPEFAARLDWDLLGTLGRELGEAGNSNRYVSEWEHMYRRYREERGPRV